jgi:hypothetical protein
MTGTHVSVSCDLNSVAPFQRVKARTCPLPADFAAMAVGGQLY